MWLPILGFEGLYEMEDGFVRNYRTQRVIPVKSGRVTLCKNGEPRNELVRELKIAEWKDTRILGDGISRIKAAKDEYSPWVVHSETPEMIGKSGEHLVCFELSRRGIRCACNVIEMSPFDVIGDLGNGKLFTIQVKTTACATRDKKRENDTPSYKFAGLPIKRDRFDVFAFVGLDKRIVMFEIANYVNGSSRSFPSPTFAEIAEGSINRVISDLYGK